MKTKLTILSVVCLVVALIAVVCLSACKKEEAHQHQYAETITPATCTEDGVKTLTCSCGDTKTEAIPATGHSWNDGEATTPATCSADGVKTFTCSKCGTTKTEAIPATGEHQWDDGVVTTPATCTTDGVKTFTCASGGETRTEPIPATGEHRWDEGVVTTPATCKVKGEKTITCLDCGESYTEKLPMIDHQWDDGTIVTAPTCSSTGYIQYKCTLCNKKRNEVLPTTDHTLTVIATVQPTCDKDGYIQSSCSVCKQLIYETLPQTGHKLSYARTVAPNCTEQGYDVYACSVCYAQVKDNFTDALGHDFDYSQVPEDDYFTMAPCTRIGCNEGERRTSPETLKKQFQYVFTDADRNRINTLWKDMSAYLTDAPRYDAEQHAFDKDSALYQTNKDFEHNYYDRFIEEFYFVTEQYQYAFINYCVYQGNSTYTSQYTVINSFRSDLVTNYYSLYRSIYDTYLREYFFSEEDGWTEEDIQIALEYSDTYGGGELAELEKQATSIETQFDALDQDTVVNDTNKTVSNLMGQFVEIQNKIAQLHGYDNYMEYAYESVYERDYSLAETAAIHDYIKSYFGSSHFTALNQAANWYEAACSHDKYYNAINGNNAVFTSCLVTNAISSYFEQMTCDEGVKPINFLQTASDLFKNGNYWTGAADRAFTWWLRAQDTPILYFGPDSYSGAFTFVHEFGHYSNFVYNKNAGMAMDLDETHSQANEMLFAVYLKEFLSDKANDYTAEAIMARQLISGIRTILLATAVDEFESIVYTGAYSGDNEVIKGIVADGVEVNEYDALGDEIFASYGLPESSYYWRFVTINSPGYYISYATSMISSLEFWAKAMNEGLEAAKECYFKLFYFTDDENNAYTDHDGDLILKIGYADVLVYCGVTSPFAEETYQTIGACIDTFTGAAHDPE